MSAMGRSPALRADLNRGGNRPAADDRVDLEHDPIGVELGGDRSLEIRAQGSFE